MKRGDKLTAINDCKINGVPQLTIGNTYSVYDVWMDGEYFSIVNDKGIIHDFTDSKLEYFFKSEEPTDSIVETVINKFKQRSEAGIKKYNTTLDRNDLSTLEWLSHLQEELMDATLYIERLKKEYESTN